MLMSKLGTRRAMSPFRSLLLLSTVFALTTLACATSPTGRFQTITYSGLQMADMGTAAFEEMRAKMPRSQNTAQVRLVECVANRIVGVITPADLGQVVVRQWEVELFEDPTANAFALPGGKMGVNTGLLDVAATPSQLAAVMGHEVAHVLARHGNARMSSQRVAGGLMAGAGMIVGADSPQKQATMAALGLGLEYGLLKPYGRGQESEADEMGLIYMARAGFDPREAVTLWQNMARSSGGQAPPEFMSTHPSNATRIAQLRAEMPEAVAEYERVVASGGRANCR